MHTSAAYATLDVPFESEGRNLHDAIRRLVEMTAGIVVGDDGPGREASSEAVLVDAEIDGSRYLLVRMARSHRNRIQLSPREQEIGRMVAKGHPNKVIADVLNISSWTVCTHLRRMFAKLGVGSRAAMVAQLVELGVIASESGFRRIHDSADG
jgi:DNA-binding CsgD family transcriptional regulator